ncbi:MAG: 16S rRNA (guanine(527)-N(7))-methyltransferase RsmG [Saprospiraceae bacterium]|nr:16S rRNA (guanine(527)-N(7))-methyltransferase RsmG [Saprospiraceae bacterium]
MVALLETIRTDFNLSEEQVEGLANLVRLQLVKSERINLVSKNDLAHLWERHVLHSLVLSKILPLHAGSSVLDIGTGGGFPTLPLAILHPEVDFDCIDGRQRKIEAVQDMVTELALHNVHPQAIRAEALTRTYDLITARAVAGLDKLVKWSRPLCHDGTVMMFFKGGDFSKELRRIKGSTEIVVHELAAQLEQDYFEDKCIVEIRIPAP